MQHVSARMKPRSKSVGMTDAAFGAFQPLERLQGDADPLGAAIDGTPGGQGANRFVFAP